jgi:hypothetical protein
MKIENDDVAQDLALAENQCRSVEYADVARGLREHWGHRAAGEEREALSEPHIMTRVGQGKGITAVSTDPP